MLLTICSWAFLVSASTAASPNELSIWDLPAVPEEKLDIGLWALVIAREYDESVDIPFYLHALDKIAVVVLHSLPEDTDEAKLFITHLVLYEKGSWNQGQVFSYDLEDPLGENPRNKLLSTYLTTRKGNCVSMPTLLLAVLERVDPELKVNGSLAPHHMYARFNDRQTGKELVLETTRGKVLFDDRYLREQLTIPPRSIDSGLYLGKLSKRAFLAELIGILVQRARLLKDWSSALAYSDLILTLSPDSVTGLVNKGAVMHQLVYEMVQYVKRSGKPMTSSQHERTLSLSREGQALIDRARELGWEPATEAETEAYLQSLRSSRLK